jgi:hypothetical protein
VEFVVDEVALGHVFFSESFDFPPSVSSYRCSEFTNISSGEWIKVPAKAQFNRDIVSPRCNITMPVFFFVLLSCVGRDLGMLQYYVQEIP